MSVLVAWGWSLGWYSDPRCFGIPCISPVMPGLSHIWVYLSWFPEILWQKNQLIFPYNVESKQVPEDLLQKLQEEGKSADLNHPSQSTWAIPSAKTFHLLLSCLLLLLEGLCVSVSVWKSLESSAYVGSLRDLPFTMVLIGLDMLRHLLCISLVAYITSNIALGDIFLEASRIGGLDRHMNIFGQSCLI